MLSALEQLAAGTLSHQPQPSGDSYQPLPKAADFRLDTSWSARRAFNFMRGTAEYGRPYSLQIANQTLQLTEALAYEADGVLGDVVVVGNGRDARIQFSPGILHTRLGS
jgi:methionyl-tRNA formyltransferase